MIASWQNLLLTLAFHLAIAPVSSIAIEPSASSRSRGTFGTSNRETRKVTKIPIDAVWGLNIAGTKDIRKLDKNRAIAPKTVQEVIESSIVASTNILLSPSHAPNLGGAAGSGFVVVGTDEKALLETRKILANKEKRLEKLPAGKPLTLVFYTYAMGKYLRLESIQHAGRQITVNYFLVSHRTHDLKTHLALIPLGQLDAGKKRVRFVQLKPPNVEDKDLPAIDHAALRRTVADSFSFIVAP